MVERPVIPIFWILLISGIGSESSQQYCGGNKLLYTEYFSPFIAKEEKSVGCVGSSLPTPQSTLHVLRLLEPDEEVYFTINDGVNTSLILISGRPTVWKLDVRNICLQTIITSVGSSVTHLNGDPAVFTSTLLDSQEAIFKVALKYNPEITTYTTIEKADTVFYHLPQIYPGYLCELGTISSSPVVKAYTATRIPSFGCFHAEEAGVFNNDVYVIHLKENTSKKNRESVDFPKLVELNLISGLNTLDTARQNLTLILKSDKPVVWNIQSQAVFENITIVPGSNTVDSPFLSWKQRLTIDETEISDDFDELMRMVTKVYGLPASYLKVYQANLLQMYIPPRSKREDSTFLERERSNLLRDKDSQSSLMIKTSDFQSGTRESVMSNVRESMIKHCSISNIAIYIPSPLVLESGISKINLNDPSCVAQDNGTHYVVSTHSTACGSTALTYGNAPLYRNNLILHFNSSIPEVRIPYMCKFKPGIPGINGGEAEDEPELVPDPIDFGNIETAQEMYGIKVDLIQHEARTSLLSSKSDSAPVALRDELYVQSHINAVRYLALAIEQCWLSSSSRASSHAGAGDLKLVLSGCPAHSAVSMHWDQTSANAAFSFQITDDMRLLGNVWLQCRMGLCSATSAGAQGNVIRCEDPADACQRNKPHRESSVQQVTVRGPLHVLPVTRNILGQIKHATDHVMEDKKEKEGGEQKSTHSPHTTLVGVTVEIAVAISLASFLVGASSTGVLWFIHSKAEKVKTLHLQRVEGTELRSELNSTENYCPSATRTTETSSNCAGCPLIR